MGSFSFNTFTTPLTGCDHIWKEAASQVITSHLSLSRFIGVYIRSNHMIMSQTSFDTKLQQQFPKVPDSGSHAQGCQYKYGPHIPWILSFLYPSKMNQVGSEGLGVVDWMDAQQWLEHRERVAEKHFQETLHMAQQEAIEAEKAVIDLYFKGVAVKGQLVEAILDRQLGENFWTVRFQPEGGGGVGCFQEPYLQEIKCMLE